VTENSLPTTIGEHGEPSNLVPADVKALYDWYSVLSRQAL
jgi:hypothetical protein